MLGQPLRRLALALAVASPAFAAGCLDEQGAASPAADVDELELGRRYVEEAQFRRDVLVASLVNPDNGYSRRRLARYDEAVWGALPEWKPDLAPVPDEWSREALVEAGRRAFFEYPIQVAPALKLAAEPGGQSYGAHNIIEVEVPDGPTTAFACATCHSRPDEQAPDVLRPGVTNHRLDYGAMLDDFYVRRTASGDWGAARVDVTPDSVDNPTAITDLRPIRLQTLLHKTASVRNGLVELAVRTETLILTNLGEAARPPRETALALAMFLRSLADDLPAPPTADESPGRAVFDATCAGCHAGEAMTGPPVALDDIATDPTVGESPARTTGAYRAPSLRGVGDRKPLFANGAVPDLPALLDPARLDPASAGHAPGHPFGLDLPHDDRASLLEFLSAL